MFLGTWLSRAWNSRVLGGRGESAIQSEFTACLTDERRRSVYPLYQRICVEHLNRDPEAEDVRSSIRNHVTMTMRFGCDQVQQTFEQLESDANDSM